MVAGELAGHVGQRLGRIGGDHDHRLGRRLHQLRHDVLEDLHICVEQPQATVGLSLQNRTVSFGPVPLLALQPIEWP